MEKGKYVELHKSFFTCLIEDARKLGNAARVLFWCLDAYIEHPKTNIIQAPVQKIATDLGISGKTVRKHLKKLIQCNYLVPCPSGQDLYAFAPQYIKKVGEM